MHDYSISILISLSFSLALRKMESIVEASLETIYLILLMLVITFLQLSFLAKNVSLGKKTRSPCIWSFSRAVSIIAFIVGSRKYSEKKRRHSARTVRDSRASRNLNNKTSTHKPIKVVCTNKRCRIGRGSPLSKSEKMQRTMKQTRSHLLLLSRTCMNILVLSMLPRQEKWKSC